MGADRLPEGIEDIALCHRVDRAIAARTQWAGIQFEFRAKSKDRRIRVEEKELWIGLKSVNVVLEVARKTWRKELQEDFLYSTARHGGCLSMNGNVRNPINWNRNFIILAK